MRHHARMALVAAAVTAVIAAVIVSVALAGTGHHAQGHRRWPPRPAISTAPRATKLPVGYTNDGSAQNKAAAQADAKHLLSLVKLPSGSTRLHLEPRGGHGYLAYSSAGDSNVAAGWWTVPLSPSALIKYVERHRPAGGHRYMTGFGGNYKTGTSSLYVGFEWRLEKYRLGPRTVEITATKLTDGKTGVLVYASSEWWVLRSERERVPQTVRRVEIQVAGWHGRREVKATISAPERVQQVVATINAFPLAWTAAESCTLEFAGPQVSIRLIGAAGRQIGAIGYMDQPSRLMASDSCSPVSFTLRGRYMQSLIGGRFMWTLQKLAGKSLVGRLGR
jgi:hypothetical protein